MIRNCRQRSYPLCARIRRAFGCLLLLCVSAPAAVLEGVVLENRSARPLARARVTLESIRGGAPSPAGSVLTDSAGRFSFHSLPGGAYLLSARRVGYLTAKYGQKRWNGAGTPVVLDADGRFFAEFRLRRLGVITGQVLDENDVGLAGHDVYAFRLGETPLRIAGGGATDDRGVYRITGLEPGRYSIRTGTRQLEDGRGLLPTFYGQTTEAGQAKPVEVDLDRETAGADIQPLFGRLAKITGKVFGGAPASVVLYSDTGKREVQVPADGTFQFDQLGPGFYQLIATSTGEPQRAAYQKVTVKEGTTDVSLLLARLPVLRIRCQDKSGQRLDAAGLSVFLRRKEPPDAAPVLVFQAGETKPLPPGEYELAAMSAAGYYVEALHVPQRGRQARELSAMPDGVLEVAVVLGSQPAGVRGKVLDAEGRPVTGAPVFLTALDPDLRARINGPRSVRAGENGEFRFFGLPPGRYQLFSSFEISEPEETDWAALPVSSVLLEERQEAALDLKLIGGL